jgi:hypothetical protein
LGGSGILKILGRIFPSTSHCHVERHVDQLHACRGVVAITERLLLEETFFGQALKFRSRAERETYPDWTGGDDPTLWSVIEVFLRANV